MDQAALAARHRAEKDRRRVAARRLRRLAPKTQLLKLVLLRSAESLSLIALLYSLAVVLAQLVLSSGELPSLAPWLITLLALCLLRALWRVLAEQCSLQLAQEVVGQLRERYTARAMDPAWRLQRRAGSGDLASRLGRELDSLQPYYRLYLPALITAAIQPLLILLLVFSQDWLAGLLLALSAPLIPLFMALIGMGSAALARDQHQLLARLGDHFLDRLRALPTLRLMRAHHRAQTEITEAVQHWRHTSMRILRVAFLSSAVLEFFAAVAVASLAIYIGLSLLGYFTLGPASGMSLQAGLIILLLAPDFFAPFRALGQYYHQRAAALAAAERLSTTVGPVTDFANAAQQAWPTAPSLRIRGLKLHYATALSSLELDLQPGEWLAVCGESGSGKSSLADALMGLLPYQGSILIDGRELRSIDRSELAANIGWLGQQPHLLSTSVRANIAPGLAADRIDNSAIAEVIASAGLEAVIAALPDGLNTRLGESGAGLSGGERQRLALARALFAKPRLLILDEPSAGLDADNEQRLLEALGRLRGECSILMLTHSATAAAAADRQLQLAGGADL